MAKTVNPEASEVAFFFIRGRGDSANVYAGRLRHEVQPLTIFFFYEKVTLSQTLFRTFASLLTAVNALSIK